MHRLGFNGKRRIGQRQQRSARNVGARRERSKRGREIALRRDIAPFEARADVAARRLVGTRGGCGARAGCFAAMAGLLAQQNTGARLRGQPRRRSPISHNCRGRGPDRRGAAGFRRTARRPWRCQRCGPRCRSAARGRRS
jgi:hypothetical protein